MSLYMVVEHFRNKDAVPVYRRFRDLGRLAPGGLQYSASWVTENLDRCYQMMETEDPALLQQWDGPLERHRRLRGASRPHLKRGHGEDRTSSCNTLVTLASVAQPCGLRAVYGLTPSKSKFSSNTFTRASPNSPSCLVCVCLATICRTSSALIPRAFATRAT
jgi:hypothetical protein